MNVRRKAPQSPNALRSPSLRANAREGRAPRTFAIAAVLLALAVGCSGAGSAPGPSVAPPAGDESAVVLPSSDDLDFGLAQASRREAAALADQLDEIADAADQHVRRLDDAELLAAIESVSGTGNSVGRPSSVAAAGRDWEIHMLEGHTLSSYARQLDFLGIELGVLGDDGLVTYAAGLVEAEPRTRRGPADQERRYYFSWQEGALREADEELLGRAGVDARGKIVLKFVSPAVEAVLAALERQHAAGRAAPVRRTRFGIRAAGSGYEFFVYDQEYD